MFKCEYCGKKLKSKSGLTLHKKTCSERPQEEETTKKEQSVEETIEAASEAPTEVKAVSSETVIDVERQRRIDKLKVTISSCYDAETKHRLEQELKELEGK